MRKFDCFIHWIIFADGHYKAIVSHRVHLLFLFFFLLVLNIVYPIFSILYGLFFASIFIHIFANIRAVKSVRLRSFNESRYLIALEEFFRSGRVLSVPKVNELERVTIGMQNLIANNYSVNPIPFGSDIRFFYIFFFFHLQFRTYRFCVTENSHWTFDTKSNRTISIDQRNRINHNAI